MKSLLFFFLSFSAIAQTSIVFDQVVTSGSGCLPGTTSVTLSPDGTSMSILFDEFSVEVPNRESPIPSPAPGRGPRYRPPASTHSIFENHKTCNITFTTILPPGQMATGIDIKVDARGSTILDQGVSAYFTTILVSHRGLANSVGPQVKVIEKKFWNSRADVSDDWITETKATVPLKANCSTNANKTIKFELKNHLNAKIMDNIETRSGLVTVDSNDARGMLTFTLATAPCR